jgi:signal transduction histidine kinase
MRVRGLLYTLTGLVVLHIVCMVIASFVALPTLTVLTSIFAVLEPVMTAVILLRLSASPSVTQKAWRIGGFSFIFFVVGAAIDGVLLVQGKVLSPSLADLFLMLGGVLFIMMVLSLPRPDTPRLKGLRLFLDVAVAAVVLIIYIWRFAFAPQVIAQGVSGLAIAIQTLYLLLNFSVFGILLTLLFWTRFSKQIMLLTLGTSCFIFGNFLFALFAPYQPMSFMLFWVVIVLGVGHALFCWGAFRVSLGLYDLSVIDPTSRFARLINRTPYSGILACYLLILAPPPKEPLVGIGVIVGVILITLIVLTRQFLQITDNENLTRDLQRLSSSLEERVAERGKQLEDSQSRLVASEKLASLGRLTAGLAHEINTPLAAAMHSLYHAKALAQEYKISLENPSVTKEDYKEIAGELEQNLSSAQTSLERLGEFVRRMRSQTRASSDTTTFYPSQLIRDVVAVLQPKANELKVTLGFFEPNEIITLRGDTARFSQVVSNLLVNALDACEGKADGFVNVRLLGHETLGHETEVRLEVYDNGVGIPEDIQAKIFEPMFTTKDVGQGTGLGLAVVYDIVHGGFGGDISVESTLGQGSRFVVRLPLSPNKTSSLQNVVSTA